MNSETSYTSFAGNRLICSGDLATTLERTKTYLDQGGKDQILIFQDDNGRQTDFDFRGTIQEVLKRAMPEAVRTGPGRPKLGVVSAEISLLPRHWEWLSQQGKSASATIRELVDAARKNEPKSVKNKRAVDAIGSFMWAMAGNLPRFEEASRALYAWNWGLLAELTVDWPPDIKNHIVELRQRFFPAADT